MATSRPGRSLDPPPGRERRGWLTRDILRALAVIAGFYIALQVLWVGRSVVLLTFLGVLFGLALSAGVDWLQDRRVPRPVGAVFLMLAFLGILVGLGALTAPSIKDQVQELRTQLPEAVRKIQGWIQERQQGMDQVLNQVSPEQPTQGQGGEQQQGGQPDEAAQQEQPGQQQAGDTAAQRPASLAQQVMQQIGGLGQHLFGIFSSTLAVLGGIILIFFVALFVAIERRTYEEGMMHLFPHEARPRAGEVLSGTAMMLRRWLLAQLASMVVVGALTTVVLMILGIKAALALGIIAGILEFIPIAGPILASIPAIAMGLTEGIEKALYVTVAYIAIQQVEANIVYPIIMKKGLEIPPVLTIFTQGVLSLVFGFLGLLVAVPLLAAVIVPIKMLYVRDVVGDEVRLPGEDEEENRKGGKGGKEGKDERGDRKDTEDG